MGGFWNHDHFQKTSIAELEQQLEEERSQRRVEREKAEVDLKAAVERVRLEALEELKRQSEAGARQHKEQLDVINKLQESDRESRALMETLRSKLEDVRETLMKAEKKVRQLEVQLREEESSSATARKKSAEKEHELQQIKMEMEKEKATREDAWAKVSTLELEIAAAIRDLGLEKQRLQGARERIVLRETQLRAFHATAEEISALQQKQQEQLNGMLRTLEDGENCELPNIDDGFEMRTENLCGAVTRVREEIMAGNIGSDGIIGWEAASDEAKTPKKDRETECVSDFSSVEMCNKNQRTSGNALEDWENGDTQEEDCADTLQITQKNSRHDTKVMDTMLNQDDEQIGTERVLATEAEATQLLESTSGGRRLEHHVYATGIKAARSGKTSRGRLPEDDEIKYCEGDLEGETMQIEDEDQAQMCWERTEIAAENQGATLDTRSGAEPEKVLDMANTSEHLKTVCHSIKNIVIQDGQRLFPCDLHKVDEMASRIRKDGNTITTNDLLTSEVPGSWAVSTPGSVHCDNESLRSDERKPGIRSGDEGLHQDFDASQTGVLEDLRSSQGLQLNSLSRDQDTQPEITPTAGSQNYPVPSLVSQQSRERQALTEMIGIVDPDFKHLYGIRRSNGNAPDSEDDDKDNTEEEDVDRNEDDDTQKDSGDEDSE